MSSVLAAGVVDALAATAEFADMAEYPYYGSIKMIDGYVVVKLG